MNRITPQEIGRLRKLTLLQAERLHAECGKRIERLAARIAPLMYRLQREREKQERYQVAVIGKRYGKKG